MTRFFLSFLSALALGCLAMPASAQVDPIQARKDFDFLIGEWKIVEVNQGGKVRAGSGELFRFRKLPQGSLEADWQINRGTPESPRMVETKFYSGFDNSSNRWNFYFVSELSAQFWPGTLREGTWYFHRDYVDNGRTITQRQWWQPLDANTLIRHIEDSTPDGKGFQPVFIAKFVRTTAL